MCTRRCLNCDYDLRGSIGAGRESCPECGEPIPEALAFAWDETTPPILVERQYRKLVAELPAYARSYA